MISRAEWQLVAFTAEMAAFATVASAPAGLGLAWVLARRDWWGKSIVETLITLPLVLPPVATGLLLLKVLGRRGPAGHFLYETMGLEVAFTWRGVVAALAVMSFPLMVRTMRVAFDATSARLEAVALTLGAHPWRVFWTVTVPLARRGLLAGLVLGFARALGEFGATIMLAGNIPGETRTLSLAIYQAVQSGDDAHAMDLLGASAALAFGAVWIGESLQRPSSR